MLTGIGQSSPTSMFRGLGAIAWVLPMPGCWILLLLTFRAYNKLWSGRKEAILKAVCGLLEQTGQADRWAACWGCQGFCSAPQRSAECLLCPSPVLSPEGQRHLPQKKCELTSIIITGTLDQLSLKHFHSLERDMEKPQKHYIALGLPSLWSCPMYQVILIHAHFVQYQYLTSRE